MGRWEGVTWESVRKGRQRETWGQERTQQVPPPSLLVKSTTFDMNFSAVFLGHQRVSPSLVHVGSRFSLRENAARSSLYVSPSLCCLNATVPSLLGDPAMEIITLYGMLNLIPLDFPLRRQNCTGVLRDDDAPLLTFTAGAFSATCLEPVPSSSPHWPLFLLNK